MVKTIIKPKIRRDICCLILNAALQVHFLTEYRKKEPCYSCLSGRALLLLSEMMVGVSVQ